MSEYKELPIKNLIKEGRTSAPGIGGISYVVYFDADSSKWKVRVNAQYHIEGDVLKIHRYYDRGLCKLPEDYEYYEKCDPVFIEKQAYNAYMDGAR